MLSNNRLLQAVSTLEVETWTTCRKYYLIIKPYRYEQQMKMVMEQSKNPTNNVPHGFGTQNIAGVTDEDQAINEALMASISQNQQNIHSNSYEPLNPE